MTALDSITAMRPALRRVEGAAAVLVALLVLVLWTGPSGEWIEWAILVLPGALALSALFGAVVDTVELLGTGDGRPGRYRQAGIVLVSATIALLAAVTLYWIAVTVYTLIDPPDRGGVLFAPFFAVSAGSILAAVVCFREALRMFLDFRLSPE